MEKGEKFPPVVVFFDGSDYWLADGFHRCLACQKAGFLDVLATVNTGTRRDAVKFACQSNHDHGLKRSNADKRKCVEIALAEYPDLSDRALADWCGVGHPFIAKIRGEQVVSDSTSPDQPAHKPNIAEEYAKEVAARTRTGKDGKQYPAPAKPAAFPVESTPPSKEAVEAGEQAGKDSEKLWLLKSTWKKTNKKDRSTFITWATTN